MLGQAFYEEFRPARRPHVHGHRRQRGLAGLPRLPGPRRLPGRRRSAFAPDYLFHLGAHTDLEYCETHPEEAYATNAMAVENAVYIANELDIPLLYIGTAGIFDGRQDPTTTGTLPTRSAPTRRAKWAGEEFVKQNAHTYLVCRAGWMMGGGPARTRSSSRSSCTSCATAVRAHVVDDKLGTPTYTRDFAHNVRLLLERSAGACTTWCARASTSRLEVAQELVAELGLDARDSTPVGSDFFAETYFAPRPDCERLVNRKLALRGLDVMRPWREALAEYLRRDYAGYSGKGSVGGQWRDKPRVRVALIGIRGLPAQYGGSETAAEEIYPRLAARGHHTVVYCRRHSVDPAQSGTRACAPSCFPL